MLEKAVTDTHKTKQWNKKVTKEILKVIRYPFTLYMKTANIQILNLELMHKNEVNIRAVDNRDQLCIEKAI